MSLLITINIKQEINTIKQYSQVEYCIKVIKIPNDLNKWKKKSVRKSKDLAGIDWNVPDSVEVFKSGAAEEPNCMSTLDTKFFWTDI